MSSTTRAMEADSMPPHAQLRPDARLPWPQGVDPVTVLAETRMPIMLISGPGRTVDFNQRFIDLAHTYGLAVEAMARSLREAGSDCIEAGFRGRALGSGPIALAAPPALTQAIPWFRLSCTPLRTGQGEVAAVLCIVMDFTDLIGTVTDIGARTDSEDALRMANAKLEHANALQARLANELRVSEQRLAFALDSTGEGVWDWDITGHSVFYSTRFRAILGLDMSCVGACPSSALMDGTGAPQLRFVEKNCVQCGLCANTCPEEAITLAPRMSFADTWNKAVVLNETEPFCCIRCSKPFGTMLMIQSMLGKLAQHSAFQGNLDRIRMCGDCRVIDMMQAQPSDGASRPR